MSSQSDERCQLTSLFLFPGVQEMSKKLERAANKTKTWKDKVAKHEGLVRLIQPGKRNNN